jgi:hypothetical protein
LCVSFLGQGFVNLFFLLKPILLHDCVFPS